MAGAHDGARDGDLELPRLANGYFCQMTGRRDDDSLANAHIRKTELIDEERKLFRYGGRAIFPADAVSIRIRALRPDSNNRFLPPEFKKYETWYGAGGVLRKQPTGHHRFE